MISELFSLFRYDGRRHLSAPVEILFVVVSNKNLLLDMTSDDGEVGEYVFLS